MHVVVHYKCHVRHETMGHVHDNFITLQKVGFGIVNKMAAPFATASMDPTNNSFVSAFGPQRSETERASSDKSGLLRKLNGLLRKLKSIIRN